MASGLTLVFGLMDVLNFGHGVFIALGAYRDADRRSAAGGWDDSGFAWAQPGAAGPAHAGRRWR